MIKYGVRQLSSSSSLGSNISPHHEKTRSKIDILHEFPLSTQYISRCPTSLPCSIYIYVTNMQTHLSQRAPCCPPEEAARLLSRPYRAASRRCDGHCYRHMYNLKQRPDAAYTASLPASYGAQPAPRWAMATQRVSAQVPASKPGRGLLARGTSCI